MPKKYETIQNKKSIRIDTEAITNQTEISEIKPKQLSKRGGSKTWWNPDSPVNKLY